MYPGQQYCFECKQEWNPYDCDHYEENICPNCGTDKRNPITYYYNKNDRYDIKNNIKGKDWLINLDLKYFLIEKQKRERTLRNTEKRLRDNTLFFIATKFDPEIVNYCEGHYAHYNISFLDLKYEDLEANVPLKFPHLNYIYKNAVISYSINLAARSIAKHQLDELYDAMELREDKGIKNVSNKHKTVNKKPNIQKGGSSAAPNSFIKHLIKTSIIKPKIDAKDNVRYGGEYDDYSYYSDDVLIYKFYEAQERHSDCLKSGDHLSAQRHLSEMQNIKRALSKRGYYY